VKIMVKSVSMSLDARTRADVEQRIHAALERVSLRILRVTARVTDRNGPRGGEDIACALDMRLRPRGRIFVEETDIDLAGAVNRAAEAAAETAVRTLERSRDLSRRAGPGSDFGTSGA
jgi:hypothetical protein